jgi:hypothetical protein
VAIELTPEFADELLDAVVAAEGEHSHYFAPGYRDRTAMIIDEVGCFYVHDGQPACLIAHVLHRAGVPLALLAAREGLNAEIVLDQLARQGVIRVDPETAATLAAAQRLQDSGASWDEAVAQARATAIPTR